MAKNTLSIINSLSYCTVLLTFSLTSTIIFGSTWPNFLIPFICVMSATGWRHSALSKTKVAFCRLKNAQVRKWRNFAHFNRGEKWFDSRFPVANICKHIFDTFCFQLGFLDSSKLKTKFKIRASKKTKIKWKISYFMRYRYGNKPASWKIIDSLDINLRAAKWISWKIPLVIWNLINRTHKIWVFYLFKSSFVSWIQFIVICWWKCTFSWNSIVQWSPIKYVKSIFFSFF